MKPRVYRRMVRLGSQRLPVVYARWVPPKGYRLTSRWNAGHTEWHRFLVRLSDGVALPVVLSLDLRDRIPDRSFAVWFRWGIPVPRLPGF